MVQPGFGDWWFSLGWRRDGLVTVQNMVMCYGPVSTI
jgi:hypothetical protein